METTFTAVLNFPETLRTTAVAGQKMPCIKVKGDWRDCYVPCEKPLYSEFVVLPQPMQQLTLKDGYTILEATVLGTPKFNPIGANLVIVEIHLKTEFDDMIIEDSGRVGCCSYTKVIV